MIGTGFLRVEPHLELEAIILLLRLIREHRVFNTGNDDPVNARCPCKHRDTASFSIDPFGREAWKDIMESIPSVVPALTDVT